MLHVNSQHIDICNALLVHGHSAFTLSIIEYIDISNLDKEKARELIISREQHYFNESRKRQLLMYNILETAGSLLGYKHSGPKKVLN